MKAFEIFKIGKHTSSNGVTREFTEADLDKIASQYNPQEHEAPIVIGHPKANAPAFGWINKIKRVGDRLIAEPKQLAAEFSQMIKDGLFKKRSVSITSDLKLNHVGFLGAAAPAVKGLKDVEFSTETEFNDFEFDEVIIVDDDATTDPPKKEASQSNRSNVNAVHNSPVPPAGNSEYITSEQLSILNEQVEKLQNKLQEFSSGNINQEELNKIHERISELRFSIQTNEFELMLNEKLAYGSVTPAMKKKMIKLINFLQTQNFSSNEFSQLEFDNSVKEILTEFVNSIPKIVYYEEFAEKGENETAVTSEDFDGAEVDKESLGIHKKALALSKSEDISYMAAVNKVSTTNE